MSSEVARLNAAEERMGVLGDVNSSWHAEFKDTSWIYVGHLRRDLTEGDILCFISQYGEVEDLNLIRDDETGESKGFAFVKFEDWRSTVLAVDNFDGASVAGSTLKVRHTRYERPKQSKEKEESMTMEEKINSYKAGHAYTDKSALKGPYSLSEGVNVFDAKKPHKKKDKKQKKDQKKKKSKKSKRSREDESTLESEREKRARLADLSGLPVMRWDGT